MTPAEAITRLYHLKVDTTTRDGDGAPHEKPHKIIHSGLSLSSFIPLCNPLVPGLARPLLGPL